MLNYLLSVRSDLNFSSSYSSEIATNAINSLILGLRFNSLMSSRSNSEGQIGRFQDFVFDDFRAIREAINSSERNFQDLQKLLLSASKFRHWLDGHAPDTDLMKAYFRKVTASSWVEKLPAKAARWVLFRGAGLALDALGAGGLSATALSVADTFLFDELIKGWNPSQFVEGSLRPFVLG